MTVTHHTASAEPNDPAYEVSRNAWNEDHDGTNDHAHTATGDGGTLDILDLVTSEMTATWVLAPDGAGGLEFRAESAGATGALVLLESHTGNNSGTHLDFTASFSSTYDVYFVQIMAFTCATSGAVPYLRFRQTGGSFDSSTIYDWGNNVVALGGAGSANSKASAPGISLFSDATPNGLSVAASALPALVASAWIYDPLSAVNYKHVDGTGVALYVTGPTRYSFKFGGIYRATAACDAFQVAMSAGNIVTGTVRCYGVAK